MAVVASCKHTLTADKGNLIYLTVTKKHKAAFRLNHVIQWKCRLCHSSEWGLSALAVAVWAKKVKTSQLPVTDRHTWTWGKIEYTTWRHTAGAVMLIKWHSDHQTTLWRFAEPPDLVWIQLKNEFLVMFYGHMINVNQTFTLFVFYLWPLQTSEEKSDHLASKCSCYVTSRSQ